MRGIAGAELHSAVSRSRLTARRIPFGKAKTWKVRSAQTMARLIQNGIVPITANRPIQPKTTRRKIVLGFMAPLRLRGRWFIA
jgi:hypothetical protein